jgi:hypothetical protein
MLRFLKFLRAPEGEGGGGGGTGDGKPPPEPTKIEKKPDSREHTGDVLKQLADHARRLRTVEQDLGIVEADDDEDGDDQANEGECNEVDDFVCGKPEKKKPAKKALKA